MPSPGHPSEREQLKKAILAQESLRGTLEDSIIDAAIQTLQEKLASLETGTRQRKLVTILFMDIAGHTAIISGLDPEDQMDLIDPALKQLAAVVERHGGHVARFQGDGFKAVFGLPAAHENDPDRAVDAGLEIQAAARSISENLISERGLPGFQVRVGIDTGLVFAGGETEGEDTIKGAVVNMAARLESAAAPGTVLISHNTYQHVRGAFDLAPPESLQAKGFSNQVSVYRVLARKARSFRDHRRGVEGVDTRMVGRDRELDLLQEIFTEICEEGERQVVSIVGEAGVGKSRLLYEFENWVDLQPVLTQLYRGRAHLETRNLPYGLLRSIFDFRFEILQDDPPETAREKWLNGYVTGLGETSLKAEKRAHILGHLLGFDFSRSTHVTPILREPRQLQDRGIVYLLDYFKAAAGNSSILLLEDLHWADRGSLDVIGEFSIRLQHSPVMIVTTARPELYQMREHWFEGWAFHRRIDLMPLSKRSSRGLVAEVLQKAHRVPEALESLIVSHAEGNPLFVEELVKVLVDEGVIRKGEEAWAIDLERLSGLDVPNTLTGVLQARLESLGKDEREILQQASVVGRVFWDQAVWYFNGKREGGLTFDIIEAGLAHLRENELVYRREVSTFEHALEYIFKHAVLRDVTYESVLKRNRQAIHRLAAEWLIEQRVDRLGEVVGQIAEHLEQAGEIEEAIRYLAWAGGEAADKYANETALGYFNHALELVSDRDVNARFDLLKQRENIYNRLMRQQDEQHDLEELDSLCEEIRSVESEIEVGLLWAEFSAKYFMFDQAIHRADQALKKADEIGAEGYVARANLVLGRVNFFRSEGGKFDRAIAYLEKALDGFIRLGDNSLESIALRSLGMVASNKGNYLEALEYTRRAHTVALQADDLQNAAEAVNNLGVYTGQLGDYKKSVQYYEQYLEIARETGNRHQELFGLLNLSHEHIRFENYSTALTYAEDSFKIQRTAIGEIYLGWIYAGQEAWDRSLEAFQAGIEKAQADPREVRSRSYVLYAQTGIAKVRLQLGDVDPAEALVDHVIYLLEDGFESSVMQYYLMLSLEVLIDYLATSEDDRLESVLNSSYKIVMRDADRIQDAETRRRFLEDVSWNRKILDLWAQKPAKNQDAV